MDSLVELKEKRETLQEMMSFLGSIASGLETAIGESANSISYVAGKNLGLRFSKDAPRTNNVKEALKIAHSILEANNCLWHFEIYQKGDGTSDIIESSEGQEVMLVFRDCMIRQSLFCFGHHQRGSLCNLMYGFFDGALQSIMGKDSTLSIIHAGENSCFKKLVIKKTQNE